MSQAKARQFGSPSRQPLSEASRPTILSSEFFPTALDDSEPVNSYSMRRSKSRPWSESRVRRRPNWRSSLRSCSRCLFQVLHGLMKSWRPGKPEASNEFVVSCAGST